MRRYYTERLRINNFVSLYADLPISHHTNTAVTTGYTLIPDAGFIEPSVRFLVNVAADELTLNTYSRKISFIYYYNNFFFNSFSLFPCDLIPSLPSLRQAQDDILCYLYKLYKLQTDFICQLFHKLRKGPCNTLRSWEVGSLSTQGALILTQPLQIALSLSV